MKTLATLKNFTSIEGKDRIVRNLNRILDIVVLDVNAKNGTITFLYSSKLALEKAKKELSCIGFPIQHMKFQSTKKDQAKIKSAL
ncbi:hypothetical protein [Maribacter sp. 2210JD10-5]|uniref:hypothetical protein n=1 Tax=Maribacter sp. 2210JD10-5 TaxID=3386272 RepID=UPI0039BC3CB3